VTDDPLSSWNDTPTKQAVVDFVTAVTDQTSGSYVPPVERIAAFDNDGTLWCEKPMYIQLDYLLRRLAAQAQDDPSLRSSQPWQAAWTKDYGWFGEAMTRHYQGDDADLHLILRGILALSEGQIAEDVEAAAKAFVESERHPTLGLAYRDCIYQPMLELLRYLEANDFIVFIVSGGGRDFMRGLATDLYGVPRERVIGSTVAYGFRDDGEGGQIYQRAELDLVNDGDAKPVAIWNSVGRRPILAAGNSDGDMAMLKFADGRSTATLRLLVKHDDPEREFDYTAGAQKSLQAAETLGWTVISMRQDWRAVFRSTVLPG